MASHVDRRPVTAAFAAPGLSATLGRLCRRVWVGMQAVGAKRARRELERLANSTSDPALAAHLRAVIAEDWLARG